MGVGLKRAAGGQTSMRYEEIKIEMVSVTGLMKD